MSDKFIDFARLMDANNNAFKYMGQIRQYISSKNTPDLVSVTNKAFSNVTVMAKEYLKIDPEALPDIQASFTRAYDNAANTVLLASKMIDISEISGEDTVSYKALFDEKNSDGLYRRIESIPDAFDSGKGEGADFNLGYVDTLHGLIRYFHQRAIVGTFDAKALRKSGSSLDSQVIEFGLNRSDYRIIDLDNQILPNAKKNRSVKRSDIINKPMQAIFDFYEQDISTQAREHYYVFLKKDSINLHMQLYQHSAEINAKFDGDNSSISFTYNEYLNDAWRDRISYIKRGLELLGFDVKGAKYDYVTEQQHEDGMLCAELSSTDEGSAKGTLTEMVRLLASTTHINCSFDSLRGLITPEFALKMFFSGKTDLYNEMTTIDNASNLGEFPYPPWYGSDFMEDYPGDTYEAKVQNSLKEYTPLLEEFWKSVNDGEYVISSYYFKVDKLSLDELVKTRLDELHIRPLHIRPLSPSRTTL